MSAAVLALVLISPHVGAYDLVLLAPVYFLLANWLARFRRNRAPNRIGGAVCASFIAPICGGLPAILRMQLTVGTMARARSFVLWHSATIEATGLRLRDGSRVTMTSGWTLTPFTFDRLVVALLFLAIFAIGCLMPAQNDTWWHLRAGQEMWRRHSLLFTETFSFTAAGAPWPNHEWLTQLGFYCSIPLVECRYPTPWQSVTDRPGLGRFHGRS